MWHLGHMHVHPRQFSTSSPQSASTLESKRAIFEKVGDIKMRWATFLLMLSVSLGGCASERIITQSHSYYQDINKLALQEVIDNIDATIDDPYRIPTRTTFGKGNLTFTDNAQASISLPLAMTPTSRGTFGANLGSYIDSYQLSIGPEVNAETLAKLRDVYRTLVYPGPFHSVARIPGNNHRWLYWTNSATPETDDPPPKATMVGSGRRHDIYVTDREAFFKFVLLTFGYEASPNPMISEVVIARPVVRRGKGSVVSDQPSQGRTPRDRGSDPTKKGDAGKQAGGASSTQRGVPKERQEPTILLLPRGQNPFILNREPPTENPNALPVPSVR